MPYVDYDEVEAICPDCDRMFRSEELLARHRQEVHPEEDGSAPRPTNPGWNCATCGRSFGTEVERNRHARESHT